MRGAKPVPGGEVERARSSISAGDVVTMDAPEDLTSDARGLWEIAVADLIALKVFRISDAPMLAEFCSCLAMAREFREEISILSPELRRAYSDKDFDRAEQISGSLKRARSGYVQTLKLAQSLGADFAMTPVARLRLGLMAAHGAKLTDFFSEDDDA